MGPGETFPPIRPTPDFTPREEPDDAPAPEPEPAPPPPPDDDEPEDHPS